MGKKRCIFHYPNPISDKMSAGSSVRPNQMLNAFKLCGYIVDDVTGYGSERKQKIREIKKNIKNGVKYDFVYSESINIPTVLSEENHIPIYPFLDFSFFTFCRNAYGGRRSYGANCIQQGESHCCGCAYCGEGGLS